MEVLVNTIQNIPGISDTETFISLDQAFERQVYVKDKSVIRNRRDK
jgi:Lrp/AsnC family transcriptional regulator for asnA, asnC and gidA